MTPTDLPAFDEGDFDLLVLHGLAVEDVGAEPMSELHRLSRRISGQYVDVLAAWARAAFHGRSTPALEGQVNAALSGLTRLAEASEDRVLVDALTDLGRLLPRTGAVGGNRRRDFMRGLADWVLAFAGLLEPEDAERMRRLVEYDAERPPLLDRIAQVRGIGPKRLRRLYCAGLFTVDSVALAAPEDVAAVTGLPLALAANVVAASRDFAEEERRALIEDLRRRSAQVRTALAGLDGDVAGRRQVLEAALAALHEIREAVRAFGDEREVP